MSTLSSACQQLLEHSHRYHPLYGERGLSNHLPMALIALDRMGAGAAQLRAFTAHYEKRLRPRTPQEPDAFERALAYIREEMRRYGPMDVVRAWLPALLPGVAAAAFHCAIRLAYAVEAQDREELAQALAYWVTGFETLGPPGRVVEQGPEQIAQELAPAMQAVDPGGGIISDRMQQTAAAMTARDLMLQPRTLSLGDIARFALHAYARQEDFTLLHTVTGTHALRLLLPLVADHDAALRWLWQGALAAYLTVGRDAPAQPAAAPALDWETCFARACGSHDDHVIKLVYSASQEAAHYADDACHLAIAARKVSP